jgi:1,5-anhydro-D-fructose reductase (1,5-anhydro-D-mannitol-forming)
MVGHMLRLSPLLLRIRELIRTGTLGTPISARADFVYDASVSHRGWLYDRKVAGGGPVFDIGVHCLDSLRFVLDDEVQEAGSLLDPEPTEARTESTAMMQMRFSGGTLGSIFCSYAAPLRRTFLEVIGSGGAASAFNFTLGDRTTPLTITRGRAGQTTEERIEQVAIPNLYIEEVTQFSDCIINGHEPPLSGENGLKNQVVLDVAMHRRRMK